MATIYDIQQGIITKLSTDITDLKIEKFNTLFEEFLSPNVKGKISVEFQSMRLSDPLIYNKIEQSVSISWKLLLVLRNFPEISEETYGYIESIQEALTGLKVVDCDALYCSSIELKKNKEDKYYYELIFINKTNYFQE